MSSLGFHKQIFADLLEEDGLLAMGKGLGLERIVASFVRLYCDPKRLVFVLNVRPGSDDHLHLMEDLRLLDPSMQHPPHTVAAEESAEQRGVLYLRGGVLFMSSRTLVVDLLTKRVPTHLISGLLVCQAHRVTEASTTAFILRLFRESNKTGFIKAFTDYPEALVSDFSHVERLMRHLFVTRLFLWPRFHMTVGESLERHQPEVVELQQPMTKAMEQLQEAIVQVMDACLQELKKTNQLDVDELTVENGLFKSFDTIIKKQLETIWHQVGPKTKQLISDLGTLRNLLTYLVTYDCVTYNRYLETLRTHEFGQYSIWLFLPAANRIFTLARSRVYISKKVTRKRRAEAPPRVEVIADESPAVDSETKAEAEQETHTTAAEAEIRYELVEETVQVPILEENPKWHLLTEVLKEIEEASGGSGGQTLIMVKDERTCMQLQEYLAVGGKRMLERLFDADSVNRAFYRRPTVAETFQFSYSNNKRRKGKGKGRGGGSTQRVTLNLAHASVPELTAVNLSLAEQQRSAMEIKEGEPGMEAELAAAQLPLPNQQYSLWTDDFIFNTDQIEILAGPQVLIHPLEGANRHLLRDLRPTYVIVYDADMKFTREIEMYKASNPGMPLRVYFLTYENSVEEQRYLSSVRKEKEAFERLIHQKATMTVIKGQDGKLEWKEEDLGLGEESYNSRKGRKILPKEKGKILVDYREFRSTVPSFLHQKGFEVVPCHLEVGDYILTPDICVERKSIPDLIQSFHSGRLYNQTEAMMRRFKTYALLIEFDPEKPFCLMPDSDLGEEIRPGSLSSKLAVLTLSFPRLRLIWCRSPHVTADMFDLLKRDNPQPDPATVNASTGEGVEDQSALAPMDVLRRLPGVTEKNIGNVQRNVGSLFDLARMSVAELTPLLGAAGAQALHHFFHHQK